jgi:hypothetical protein
MGGALRRRINADGENVSQDRISLTQVNARPTHAVGDPRSPTRYQVCANDEAVGYVFSRSSESWGTSSNGRIRTTFRGYSRSWGADYVDGTLVTKWACSRRRAVKDLIDYHRKAVQ